MKINYEQFCLYAEVYLKPNLILKALELRVDPIHNRGSAISQVFETELTICTLLRPQKPN